MHSGALLVLLLLPLAGLAQSSGASRTTAPPPVARRTLPNAIALPTDGQVREWINVWQKRLGLGEWEIDAKIVRIWDLPQDTIANIHWTLSSKKATIKVLNAVDSTLKPAAFLKDTELSVVHELVHLSMAKLPLDPKHTELEEEAVKRISTALVAAVKR
jgi:hypothetical protein